MVDLKELVLGINTLTGGWQDRWQGCAGAGRVKNMLCM
jgi:hypothetical protein